VERSEADAIYDEGHEPVVAVLLRLDEHRAAGEARRPAGRADRAAGAPQDQALVAQLVSAAEPGSADGAQARHGSLGAQRRRSARSRGQGPAVPGGVLPTPPYHGPDANDAFEPGRVPKRSYRQPYDFPHSGARSDDEEDHDEGDGDDESDDGDRAGVHSVLRAGRDQLPTLLRFADRLAECSYRFDVPAGENECRATRHRSDMPQVSDVSIQGRTDRRMV
jgi:hypothetical protein